jgi:VIT1/CCC1 family predicted Fe2+/Mn2+ transporter
MTEPTANPPKSDVPAVNSVEATASTPETTSKPPAQSPAVLTLGFIILMLLGALIALNLKPRDPIVESSSDIAARIKKDSETLISMSGHTQGELGKKDAELLNKIRELKDAEITNRLLVTQLGETRAELEKALAQSGDSQALKSQLTLANQRSEVLGEELSKTKAQLALYAGQPQAADFADLERRLEESNRAKEFFEGRVKELEAKLGQVESTPEIPITEE